MLLNGNTQERARSSDGCTVLPCGCAHTESRWLQMCDFHGGEWLSQHAAALAEHRRQEVSTG